MQELINKVVELEQEPLIRIITAIALILIFWATSSKISYLVIKIFKAKNQSSKKIKSSAFYKPLGNFIKISGIYLAIVLLKDFIGINEDVMNFIYKAYRIVIILTFTMGIAECFSKEGVFTQKIKKQTNKNDALLNLILKAIRGVIYFCGIYLIIIDLGYNLSGLIAGLGISGVILTLAAQDTAKNLFGGIVIFFDRPFAIGDLIEMEGYKGTVEKISFRSTTLKTFENASLNIPNSVISNTAVINWTSETKRRYKINLCLEFETKLDAVNKFVETLKQVLSVRNEEPVIVNFEEITDDGYKIIIAGYINTVEYKKYLEEIEIVNYKIMQVINEQKIGLAYKTEVIQLKSN